MSAEYEAACEVRDAINDSPGEACQLTLRDYFAAASLASLAGCPSLFPNDEAIAYKAYQIADAMLVERNVDRSRQRRQPGETG